MQRRWPSGAPLWLAIAFAVAPALVFAGTGTALATSCAPGPLTVSTNADAGAGSLRAAYGNLNAVTGGTICIDTTLVTAPIGLNSTVSYAGTGPVTIDGNGATVEGNNTFRLILDSSSALFTIDSLTLTGGNAAGASGGAIHHGSGPVALSKATVTGNAAGASAGAILATGFTITNSTVSNNTSDGNAGGIEGTAAIVITNSTFRGNVASGGGGALEASSGPATVTVMNSTLSNNAASNGDGGAIRADGVVTVTNSTVSSNTASANGGGVNSIGAVTVTGSTISANGAHGGGGGIFSDGAVTVTNSTISGNAASLTASGGGGGIRISDAPAPPTLTLIYATIANNSSPASSGSNVDLGSVGRLTSFASVIALPVGGGTNCAHLGAMTSQGFNLEDDTAATCGFSSATTDLAPGTAPLLGPLANNGGPTQTQLPQDGPSPLIDGVPAASCQADGASGITTDQRGLPRPDTGSPNCDIGSVEVQPAAAPLTVTFTG
jgi:hypothetical protein